MLSKTLLLWLVVSFLSDLSYGQTTKKFFRKDYQYMDVSEAFYKVHATSKNWTEATRVCAVEGAHLFFPDNNLEAEAVISYWNRTQPSFSYSWVGLSDIMTEGVFETVDGKPVTEVYNTWVSGGKDGGTSQNCVYMYKEGGGLDDYPCATTFPFICKKTLHSLEWNYCCDMPNKDYSYSEETGKCYKLHTTPLTWSEAYAACRAEQTHLAVIDSQAEADYLAKLTVSTPKQTDDGNYLRGIYHMGFHNRFNEGWQTVRGTPLSVNGIAWWDHYEPTFGGHEQCGSMFFNGRLNNVNCHTKSFFICEHKVGNLGNLVLPDVVN